MPEGNDNNTNNGAGTNQQNNQNNQQAQSGTPATWDDWLNGQDEQVRGLYDAHIAGLRNTVQATREERDNLSRQIKELSSKAEKGSELEKSIAAITERMEATNRRADFIEEAVKPEIGCTNTKAAWALATAENLFTRNGAPDWNAIRAAAPELFRKPGAKGNAGDGTQEPPQKTTMNDFIRRAAGKA